MESLAKAVGLGGEVLDGCREGDVGCVAAVMAAPEGHDEVGGDEVEDQSYESWKGQALEDGECCAHDLGRKRLRWVSSICFAPNKS